MYICSPNYCGSSSVGRARPCQGRGREFESRFPLKKPCKKGFFYLKGTRSRNRTGTTFSGHRILSPACLPVSPPGQKIMSKTARLYRMDTKNNRIKEKIL